MKKVKDKVLIYLTSGAPITCRVMGQYKETSLSALLGAITNWRGYCSFLEVGAPPNSSREPQTSELGGHRGLGHLQQLHGGGQTELGPDSGKGRGTPRKVDTGQTGPSYGRNVCVPTKSTLKPSPPDVMVFEGRPWEGRVVQAGPLCWDLCPYNSRALTLCPVRTARR